MATTAPPWVRSDSLLAFAGRAAWSCVRGPHVWPEVLRHAALVGRRCVLPVTISMLPFGAVISVQGMQILALFGAQRLLSGLLALCVVRELAPVLTAVLVAAQAGSSYAAELGAMRIKEEIDATEVMAVEPVSWHVAPRILAMTLVCPALTALGTAAGLFGGWVVAGVGYHQSAGVFLDNLMALMGVWDLWAGSLKGAVFGAMVGVIATTQGFRARGGAEGVGRAVNDTVVLSVVLVLVVNYVLSTVMFTSA